MSALAYITDSYFIGTISLVHDIPRFSSPAELEKLLNALKNPSDLDDEDITRALRELKEEEAAELRRRLEGALNRATTGKNEADHKELGMMVSLDHSIYFHNPRAFRADEWMLTEMESPWAGEGRGLAIQKIWSKDGLLIATCMQEVCICFFLFILGLSANSIIGCCAIKARQAPTVEDLESLCYTPTLKELYRSYHFFFFSHIFVYRFGLCPPRLLVIFFFSSY